MTKKQEQMKDAQKLARAIERATDGFISLVDWFEGTQITVYPETSPPEWEEFDKAFVVFGDCPWTELVFDNKTDKAYVYVGRYGKARVPQRAIYELREFFNTLHNC